jgi:hypothetical protein
MTVKGENTPPLSKQSLCEHFGVPPMKEGRLLLLSPLNQGIEAGLCQRLSVRRQDDR